MQLPPEDRRTSPYTGWTRAHWEAVADTLLTAVRPYASPGRALINLPGPRPSSSGRRSDGLEGFARTFLLAAFRIAGADGADPHGLLERYAAGLDAGTRRPTTERDLADGDGESWGVIADRSQPLVEAASIATALRLTRPWLWDRLDEPVRERAGRWLADALHRAPVDNNWWLFPLTVGGFLAEVGIETEAARAAVRRGLDRIQPWYLGDGWYTDGRPRAFDHYNGWALHLYPVLDAHLAGDAARTARYGARLAAHLDGYARLFGADGAPVHQGRSLSYRFAAAAPLWAGALTGHTPLSPGATRRIASGALRHFVDRGAVGADGLLALGWYGAHPPLVQAYSGPASPYWASKGFLGLLLPADHPVWTEPEEPGPAEAADAVVALPAPAGWSSRPWPTGSSGCTTTAATTSPPTPSNRTTRCTRASRTPRQRGRSAVRRSAVREPAGRWARTGPTVRPTTGSPWWSAGWPASAAGSGRWGRATAGRRPRTAPGSAGGNSPVSPSPR